MSLPEARGLPGSTGPDANHSSPPSFLSISLGVFCKFSKALKGEKR